ncbi:MAG: Hvo_1808 family surface protein [Halovenus sp.]
MRRALLVVALVVLAGCAGLAPTATPDDPTDSPEPTAEADTDGINAPSTDGQEGGDADAPATDSVVHEERPDPETDVLGWHDGYWYDDPVTINVTDGLNESELDAVVARTGARVEMLRDLPFEETVDVRLINRSSLTGSGGEASDTTAARFEDEQFRALFLVGDTADASQREAETTGQTVGGFYSPTTGEILVVTDSGTPRVDVSVLAHELTHALQDQHFDLRGVMSTTTQDRTHARLGLVEGDAEVVRTGYEERCGEVWACVEYGPSGPGGNGSGQQPGSSVHLGLYMNSFFPYNDGVEFVEALRSGEDWTPVDEAYERPPDTSKEIIDPAQYGLFEPAPTDLPDRSTDAWEPLSPPGSPRAQVVGQASLSVMFAYTLYDDFNQESVVGPDQVLNREDGESNGTNPLNYDLAPTRGWTGDRLLIYDHAKSDETAHVWRITWESGEDAETFVTAYEELLAHWGGTERDGTWQIPPESPFTGAYDVQVDDRNVTITNAPTPAQLEEVNRAAR